MLLESLEERAQLKNGKEFLRKEIDGEVLDPFFLLETVDLYPKWYWENREGTTQIASFGCAHREWEIPEFTEESSPNIRFFGSFYFPTCEEPFWQGFAENPFFLPAFEWSNLSGKVTFASQHLLDEKEIFLPRFTSTEKGGEPFSLLQRVDFPAFPEWKKNVFLSLEQMKKRELEKVVLARRTSLTFQKPLSPLAILRRLKEIRRNSYLFLYQPAPHLAFIGASPEPLYMRKGDNLFSEAIAGTRKRGETPEEDEKNRLELLQSAKETREFLFVQEFLQNTLSPFCETLEMMNERSILLTPYVQHLHTLFQGKLRKEISDKDLLMALHPTPATLGSPSADAAHFLKKQESLSRGLYTAPIGWISPEGAEFAVGIRSCLVENQSAHLFAAAGIVLGSDPEKEWEELEQKITLFKKGVFFDP